MLAWFVVGFMGAAVVSSTEVLSEGAALGVWFGSVLLWWTIDAFFINRWTHVLQVVYAEMAQEAASESMVEAFTLPLVPRQA